MATHAVDPRGQVQRLVGQVEDTAKQAGSKLGAALDEMQVRERLDAVGDAVDTMRLAVVRRVRGAPATRPLEDMTVRELHELATAREIPGRSSMNRDELIDALRSG